MNKLLLISIFFLSILSFSNAQDISSNRIKAMSQYEHARIFYKERDLDKALYYIEKTLHFDNTYPQAWMLKAVIYEDRKIIDSAVIFYKKSLSLDTDFFPNAFYSVGKLEYQIGLYKDAEQDLKYYIEHPKASVNLRLKAEHLRLENAAALNFTRNEVPFTPINMGDSINSEFDDYFPITSIDENYFIITRRYLKEYGEKTFISDNLTKVLEEDFFISKKDSLGIFTKSVLMDEPVNSNMNEGAQSISPDGKYLFFAACGRENGYGSCDIYVSIKNGDKWGKPFNLGRPINSQYWESQPSMSSDGKTLFFCSNRPGGYGQSDIWVTTLDDGGIWSEPVNLGSTINTEKNENSPFIHPDQKTLYFASNGHRGLGGLDIFYSRFADNKWEEPINLGYPINTYADEATLSLNALGDTAYFSSDKLGGKGQKDIYKFELYEQARPIPVTYFKGVVLDKETLQPLMADFELISLSDNKVVVKSFSDKITGDFLVCLPLMGNYALNVSCPNYLFYSEHFELDSKYKNKHFNKRILMSKIDTGVKIVLKNIFFDVDKADLKNESIAELDRLYRFLNLNKYVKIEVSGHTDNTGREEYNLSLSEKRAQSVATHLINMGISSDRIKYVGYGQSSPIATNETEEGRSQNRRTEIKIIE